MRTTLPTASSARALAIAASLCACTSPGATGGWRGEPLVGRHVFVAGEGDGALHAFDPDTGEEVATIAIGREPGEVGASPDGRTLWVVLGGEAAVALVDAATLDVRRVAVGAGPEHSYLDPDGLRVWVGDDGAGDVAIVELATGAVTRSLTGNGHHKIAFVVDPISRALRFAYVSNLNDATIAVLDRDGAPVTTTSVGPAPHGMDYSTLTRRVYGCSGDDANDVEVLDPFGDPPHAIVDRIPLAARCSALHVEGDGAHALATLSSIGALARIDLASREVVVLDAGPTPDAVALTADGRAFVANVTAPTVSVIDLASGGSRRTIAVGQAHVEGDHSHRGLSLAGDRLYVPNEEDGTVTVIDVTNEAPVATLEGIGGPAGVAVAGAVVP